MTVPFTTDYGLRAHTDKAWAAWLASLPPQAAIQALAPRYYTFPGEPYPSYDEMTFRDLYVDDTVKPLGMIAREIAERRTEMVAEDIGVAP